MDVRLEGNSLVKSTRYLIVISFQGGIFCPNRPVFNLMILCGLDTLKYYFDMDWGVWAGRGGLNCLTPPSESNLLSHQTLDVIQIVWNSVAPYSISH